MPLRVLDGNQTATTLSSVVTGGEHIVAHTVPSTLTYTARADSSSRAAFDTKFQSIVAELYRSPDLASYMTNVTSCTVYLAKVTGESPSIIARNRTWAREVTLDVNATAEK